MTLIHTTISTTSKSKHILSAKDTAKAFAAHKASGSWCVDMSANSPILLHALSNRTATVQDIKLGFTEWANASRIRVECKSYPDFLNSLPERVMSQLPRVYGLGMRPNHERFITDGSGIKLANIFNPVLFGAPSPIPAPFDVSVDLFGQQVPEILAEMLTRVFPAEDERRFMVQRIAAIVKTPMRRVKHAVIIVGAGGTGKSSVLDIIETVLGGKHVNRSSNYQELFDKFSETLVNNRVVGIEDKAIGRGGESYVYTNLKQSIDYNLRSVSIKHQQRSVMREMFSHLFITTNKPDLFPWDENERRFFAPQYIDHKESAEDSGVFLTRFHEFLALPQTPAHIYHWLMGVVMDGFEYGRCPRTSYMNELVNQSVSMLDTLLDEFLDERDLFHPGDVSNYFVQRKHRASPDEIKSGLTKRGFEYKRMTFRCEGYADARFSVWRKAPPTGRHFRDVTVTESLELMHKQGVEF